jgi:hypothetical protein
MASLLLVLLMAAPALHAGTTPVKVTPVITTTREAGVTFLPLENCIAHLVPSSNVNTELTYPCGEWFTPPPDRYRVWAEKDDLISPSPSMLNYSGTSGRGLEAGIHMGPAGTVESAGAIPEGHTLRLVGLDSHVGPVLRQAFERRVQPGPAGAAVKMPIGRVLVGLFDKGGDAVALCSVLEVRKGQTVSAKPKSPARSESDLLVVLDRPRFSSARHPDDVELQLDKGGDLIAPDVLMNAVDRVIAVWYGISPGAALVNVISETLHLDPIDVALRSSQVTTARARLEVKPALDVSVVAPADAFAADEEWLLVVHREGEMLTTRMVYPNDSVRLESLPPERLAVELRAGPWRHRRTVDLSDGADGRVEFVLEPLVVSGEVSRNRQSIKDATVKFRASAPDEWVADETDEDGRYSVVLWQPRDYPLLVETPERSLAPYLDFVRITESRTLDIRLPSDSVAIRVTNAETGAPIAGARVVFENVWNDDESGRRNVVLTAESDPRGMASSPPLRPGDVSILVTAADFEKSERITRTVETARDVIDVRLIPSKSFRSLHVELPDGRPAAGAELLLVNARAQDHAGNVRRADDGGTVSIAGELSSTLVVIRHPGAGGRVIAGWELSGVDRIRLDPPSPPLRIRVSEQNGEPIQGALLALFVNDLRVRSIALAFLGWTRVGTDSSGIWVGDRLPATVNRVLAWQWLEPAAVDGAAYDALAVAVPHPWPDLVTIRSLD